MDEELLIADDSGDPDFFAMIPNMVDDLGLSVYAYRLYGHLKRVIGDKREPRQKDGKCWQSVATLAAACNMSTGVIGKAREELVQHGLIRVKRVDNPSGGRDYIEITIVNIWKRNSEYKESLRKGATSPHELTTSPHELTTSPHELTTSPHELKKNPIKNNPILNARAPQPAINEQPDDPLARWFETIGVMITAQDIPALNKMTAIGATVQDLQDALAWWKSTGKTVYSARQMASSVETAIRKRKQQAAPAGNPTQSPGKSRAETLAEIERQRQERIARKRKEREAFEAAYGHDAGSGNSAGQASGVAPGIATVGD